MRGGFRSLELFCITFKKCGRGTPGLQMLKQLLREFARRCGSRIVFLRHGAWETTGLKGLREVFAQRKGREDICCEVVLKKQKPELLSGAFRLLPIDF